MSDGLTIQKNTLLSDIKSAIYDIRGQKVMLDYDLACVYGVKTATLNQAVKRNLERFPEDFMFRLTVDEWEDIIKLGMISQFVTSSMEKRKKTALPYAFTEHGAVMLASVLRSPSAIQMSVMVTRAFIAMRQAISTMLSMDLKVEQLSHKVDQLNNYIEEILHDQNDVNQMQEQTNNEIAIQIEAINDALDQLRVTQSGPRTPIGYKK